MRLSRLVHSGITALLNLFPDKHCHEAVRREYNRRFALEMERIRDFLILHYTLNQRTDSEMWRYCAHMPLPESLRERMDLFNHGGHIQIDNHDLFGAESWLAVHLGQLNFPLKHAPLLDMRPKDARSDLVRLKEKIRQTALAAPGHAEFLQRHLALAAA